MDEYVGFGIDDTRSFQHFLSEATFSRVPFKSVNLINGANDLCTPLVAKTMYDSIPNSRWELFDDCRHVCFVEDTDRYCRLLNEWMEQND